MPTWNFNARNRDGSWKNPHPPASKPVLDKMGKPVLTKSEKELAKSRARLKAAGYSVEKALRCSPQH